MSEPATSALPSSANPLTSGKTAGAPARVLLVPYPKIVFLYPLLLASIAAGICMSFIGSASESDSELAKAMATIWLFVLAVNLVVLSFDFPRTTSLTLFFFGAAVVMGLVLLFSFYPEVVPFLHDIVSRFRPWANATFYWSVSAILAAIFFVVMIVVRFDYWEVRPNELLHHHGFLSNLERLSAPHLRIEKEINDVFEYLLLRSGRLILQGDNDRRAIILDNVPRIEQKEEAITRMLGALQVQVRPNGG